MRRPWVPLLFLCALACERQDFTGPLLAGDAAPDVVDAAPDTSSPIVDAGPDVVDAAEASPPDAPSPTPTSCKDALAQDKTRNSGILAIDTDGAGARAPIDVYCDMTTAGGGWTLVARSVQNATTPFGWTEASGDVHAIALQPGSGAYSLSPAAYGLAFSNVLVGAISSLGGPFDFLFVYELPIDDAFVQSHASSATSVQPQAVRGCDTGVPSFLRHVGYTGRTGSFFLRDSDDSAATSGLTAGGFVFAGVAPPDGVGCPAYGGLYGAQGMIMVR